MNKQNHKTRAILIFAAVGVMLGMGGCGTGNIRPLNIAEVDRSGRNSETIYISVGSVGGIVTSDQVCNDAPGALSDERCKNRAAFYGVQGTHYLSSFGIGRGIPVLVPKNEKVGANDIIRIRLADGVPAYFEKVITVGGVGFGHNGKQHDTTSDCYNENRSGVAVICPKYNWSYKDLESRN